MFDEQAHYHPDHLINDKTVLKQLLQLKRLGINTVNSPYNNFSIKLDDLNDKPYGGPSAAEVWDNNHLKLYDYFHSRSTLLLLLLLL